MCAQPEILAPCGSPDTLRAAVYAGADAVYLGLQGFNARAGAGNFTASALAEAVCFCHARGVKVYVTLNTLLFESEIPAFLQAARDVAQSGADAAIVQDWGAVSLLQKAVPLLPLHGSTQMSIHSAAGARQAQSMGLTRVVLSRELSQREIADIHAQTDIELECFVHGALCMSVSGQCYMSAFLGGRSGNRGCCAGPCRLPFSARGGQKDFHLSLKDLSLADKLPQMRAAGVCSAKIEGRLRDAEYVAAAVNACVCARDGKPYNAALLRDAFSRSGFTSAYFDGKISGEMFGVRTAQDAAAAKAAAPQLRELYRRERENIGVDFSLQFTPLQTRLTVRDADGNTAEVSSALPLQPAQQDLTPAYTRALQKTGGTPFFARDIQVASPDEQPPYLPAAEVSRLRREALDGLLQVRQTPRPYRYISYTPVLSAPRPAGTERIEAMFADLAQVPQNTDCYTRVWLPLAQYAQVPQALRARTVLYLPRVCFGAAEPQAAQQIAAARSEGFLGFGAQNIAHFNLLQGLPIYGAFGLNVTNSHSAQRLAEMGARHLTLSVEGTLGQLAQVRAAGVTTALLAYGYMPLMLTRACPLQNVQTCAACRRSGTLTDRKRAEMRVECNGQTRTVYNAVPLYMGERTAEIPADTALLYFTSETRERCAEVTEMFVRRRAFDGAFTRGLYYKGTQN